MLRSAVGGRVGSGRAAYHATPSAHPHPIPSWDHGMDMGDGMRSAGGGRKAHSKLCHAPGKRAQQSRHAIHPHPRQELPGCPSPPPIILLGTAQRSLNLRIWMRVESASLPLGAKTPRYPARRRRAEWSHGRHQQQRSRSRSWRSQHHTSPCLGRGGGRPGAGGATGRRALARRPLRPLT